jgi:GNAT superfamily N-acetyltransferase
MRTRLAPPGSATRRAVAAASGEEIGFVQAEVREGLLDLRWIELMPEHRGWGHGSEAVRLLETEAAGSGAALARVDVPSGNGLALYFWLRLGYRPVVASDRLRHSEDRPPSRGYAGTDGMRMVRELKGGP